MKRDTEVEGTIFDFKRFATGDGPGIRGLIFLKGCPLECNWCANPESQDPEPEIMYHQEKCHGSEKCLEVCPQDAIEEDEEFGLTVDDDSCDLCGACIDQCPYGALELVGERVTVAEIMDRIRNDKSFYDNSGGGITLTGGEPLFQPDFSRELLKRCRDYNISTAVETSGYSSWENLKSVTPYLNIVFFDFKHLNPELHEKYTGASNELIKVNLKKLAGSFSGDLIIRIPLVPGHNSSKGLLEDTFSFLGGIQEIKRIELMPYHRFGVSKHHGTGREYELPEVEPVKPEEIEFLTDIGHKYGLETRIDAK
jgi:pyruvate formate lyase activating enzyme